MAIVWLHKDSESGTPHLHAAVSRMTGWGQMNNDHAIHLRAQRAAEIIARRYGWTTACEIRDNNLRKVSEDCMDIVRGYVLAKGNAKYKASELGCGRNPREDEMEWAHRCAQAAIAALGKRARYGRRR